MATLDELKTRIKLELNRDDMDASDELETALSDAITRAIEFHADEQFWFNRTTGNVSTVIGTNSYSLPAALRRVTKVVQAGNALKRVRAEAIEHQTESGIPTLWAGGYERVIFFPVPSTSQTMVCYGVAVESALSSGSSSNDWTTHGYDLIAAAARKILCRDVLRDPEGQAAAEKAELEFLEGLRAETRRMRWLSAA